MRTSKNPRKKYINGAFTFISQDALASQLIDVYYEMKQLPADSTYRLYIQFDFLDSKAKKLIFRMLTILNSVSKKNSFPRLKIHYLYQWEDEDMEELGLLMAEHLVDSVHLCQVDNNVRKNMRVV